jgi:hypothetical protein
MIDSNLLWMRIINPTNGRLIKEPTVLGWLLIGAGLIALTSLTFFLALFL